MNGGSVTVYTDGACSGNPGAGGWCAILTCRGVEKTLSGGSVYTTNNRMELTAVIEGLKALKRPCSVTVVTDSSYIVDAVQKGWLKKWKRSGWVKSDRRSAVLNDDLWKELDRLLAVNDVTFEWIRGHAGHPYNERCDAAAVEQSRKYSSVTREED
ncbi:MAG: ribonuclease HI [Clostridia bacterium]|nr:ribonuclease HI [Clostridia bacterium]